jgi:hypothetical protein
MHVDARVNVVRQRLEAQRFVMSSLLLSSLVLHREQPTISRSTDDGRCSFNDDYTHSNENTNLLPVDVDAHLRHALVEGGGLKLRLGTHVIEAHAAIPSRRLALKVVFRLFYSFTT